MLRNHKKEDGEERKDDLGSLNEQKSTVQTVLDILKAKLEKNLKKIPSVYTFGGL